MSDNESRSQPQTLADADDDFEFPPADALRGPTSRETAANVADAINELPGIRARKRTETVRLRDTAVTTAYVIVSVSMPKRSTVRSLADRLRSLGEITVDDSHPASLNYELIEAESFPDEREVVAGDISPRRVFREWILRPQFHRGFAGPSHHRHRL